MNKKFVYSNTALVILFFLNVLIFTSVMPNAPWFIEDAYGFFLLFITWPCIWVAYIILKRLDENEDADIDVSKPNLMAPLFSLLTCTFAIFLPIIDLLILIYLATNIVCLIATLAELIKYLKGNSSTK